MTYCDVMELEKWHASPSPKRNNDWFRKHRRIHVVGLITSEAVRQRTLEQQFYENAEKWDRETAHLSSPAQRFAHASYIAILGMARDNREEIIDLLLRDMQENRREWFWALSYLTHENPIERKDSGKLDRMIKAWVRWGQQHRGHR